MRVFHLIFVIVLTTLLGCSDDRPGSELGADGGVPDAQEADAIGDQGLQDTLPQVMNPMMRTPPPRPPQGTSCDNVQLPAANASDLGTCSDQFMPCLANATTTDERAACYESEPPTCYTCINDSINHCSNQNGCNDHFAELTCCLETQCPNGDESCVQNALAGGCLTEDQALTVCINETVSSSTCTFPDRSCLANPMSACEQPIDYPEAAPAERGQCSANFTTCLSDARSQAEATQCIDNESEACRSCMSDQASHCASQAGCDDELGVLNCCLNTNCANGDAACVRNAYENACASSAMTWNSCVSEKIQSRECAYPDTVCLNGMPPQPTGSCEGSASSTGTVSGRSVPLNFGITRAESGGIGMVLTPTSGTLTDGAWFLLVNLRPIPGQLSYPPASGLARCGVVEKTANGFRPVGEAAGCEVNLSSLRYATAEGVCDGHISGIFRGLWGVSPFAGTFDLPLEVAESQISGGCRPRDAICSSNSDCCSGSCFPALGTCH